MGHVSERKQISKKAPRIILSSPHRASAREREGGERERERKKERERERESHLAVLRVADFGRHLPGVGLVAVATQPRVAIYCPGGGLELGGLRHVVKHAAPFASDNGPTTSAAAGTGDLIRASTVTTF